MRGQITIQSAIDELQRNFKLLNEKYFDGKLEKPVITILVDSTSGAYGWISTNKIWSTKDNDYFREINIAAEYMNRPAVEIIVTLLHEMCHLWNIQQGIQDCSRSGTYHNTNFKDVAERCGLIVKKTEKYGFSHTEASADLTKLVERHCRKGCFKLERMKTYKDGTPKTTVKTEEGKEKTTSRAKCSVKRFQCPDCGLIIRATKDISEKVKCVDCDKLFVLTEN